MRTLNAPAHAPTGPAPSTASRLDHIDGIRGIAVLAVLCYHLWIQCGNPSATNAVAWWNPLSRGYVGVHLFLVVSGFCVCWPYVANRQVMHLPQFTLRRALRLMPPYLVALGFFTLVTLICSHLHGSWPAWGANTKTAFPSVLWHAVLLHNFFTGHIITINGSFWSLALEAQLYTTVPLLVYVARRFHPVVSVGLALAVSLAFRFYAVAHLGVPAKSPVFDVRAFAIMNSLPSRWFEFALGMGAACFLARGKRLLPWRCALLAIILVESAASWLVTAGGPYHPLVDPLFGLGAFVLLTSGLEKNTPLHALLTWSPLAALGEISYSLYLLHQPFLELFASWWRKTGWAPVPMFLAAAIPSLILCVALAKWFYVWIEGPSHRVAKRLLASRRQGEHRLPVGTGGLEPVSSVGLASSGLVRPCTRSLQTCS